MIDFKESLKRHCSDVLLEKIKLLSAGANEIKASMENETKSSMGDKHETSRARMQAELEKYAQQIEELKTHYEFLIKQNTTYNTNAITHQSLVLSNRQLFYISVPIGKIELDGKVIYAISAASPIGKSMLGLKLGDVFHLNGVTYRIEEIN